MKAFSQSLFLFVLTVGAQQGICQSLMYVDPGIASCPAAPAATAPKTVQRGAPVSGNLRVTCGFDLGSYTVTLNSSDAGASISPKTMIINFGRVVGNGRYTIRFSNVGLHSVSVAITANMGSPAVRGHFASAGNDFEVVQP